MKFQNVFFLNFCLGILVATLLLAMKGMTEILVNYNRGRVLDDEDEWLNIPSVIRKLFTSVNNDLRILSKQLKRIHKNLNENKTLANIFAKKMENLEELQKIKELHATEHFTKIVKTNEKINEKLESEFDVLSTPQRFEITIAKLVDQKVSERLTPLEKKLRTIHDKVCEIEMNQKSNCQALEKYKLRILEFEKNIDPKTWMFSLSSQVEDAVQILHDKLFSVMKSLDRKEHGTANAIEGVADMTAEHIRKLDYSCNCEFKNLHDNLRRIEASLATQMEAFNAVKTEWAASEIRESIPSLSRRIAKIEESLPCHQNIVHDLEQKVFQQVGTSSVAGNNELALADRVSSRGKNASADTSNTKKSFDFFQNNTNIVKEDVDAIIEDPKGNGIDSTHVNYLHVTDNSLRSKCSGGNTKEETAISVLASYETSDFTGKSSGISNVLIADETSTIPERNSAEQTVNLEKQMKGATVSSDMRSENIENRSSMREVQKESLEARCQQPNEHIASTCKAVRSCSSHTDKKATSYTSIDSPSACLEVEALKSRVSSLECNFNQWVRLEKEMEELTYKVAQLEGKCFWKECKSRPAIDVSKIQLTVEKVKGDVKLIQEREKSITAQFQELEQRLRNLIEQPSPFSNEDKSVCGNELHYPDNTVLVGKSSLSMSSVPSCQRNSIEGFPSVAAFIDEIGSEFCSKKYIEERLESMWMSFVSLLARKQDIV